MILFARCAVIIKGNPEVSDFRTSPHLYMKIFNVKNLLDNLFQFGLFLQSNATESTYVIQQYLLLFIYIYLNQFTLLL